MQVSYEWLNEFVDLSGIEPSQIAHKLTMSGLEVEEIEYKNLPLQISKRQKSLKSTITQTQTSCTL